MFDKINGGDSKLFECKENRKLNIQSSKIIICKDDFENSPGHTIVSLKHPKYGKETFFLLNESSKKIYEIQMCCDDYNSWMVNDSIVTNGNLYILSPIDPLFIILPQLKKHCLTKAIPLEHLLASCNDGLKKIFKYINTLNFVADLMGSNNISAYKYNEGKTLSWLKCKVEKIIKVLQEKNIYVESGAVSSTYITVPKNGNDNKDLYMKYGHGLISEYLTVDMSNLLFDFLGLNNDSIESQKRKSSHEENLGFNKKIKIENNITLNENSIEQFHPEIKKNEIKNMTNKEKQRQKAAIGTKSIATFFTKKNK